MDDLSLNSISNKHSDFHNRFHTLPDHYFRNYYTLLYCTEVDEGKITAEEAMQRIRNSIEEQNLVDTGN
nr:hypothetical protein [Bacteroidota bacterium]